MYSNIVFIDFDGTITSEETLVGVLKRLIPLEFEEKKEQMLSGRLTLSAGVQQLFNSIPSTRYPEIEEYIKGVSIRPGFEELIDYLAEMDIPVVIISGGIRHMIDICIGKYRSKFLEVYSVELDLSGENMKLISQYDDGVELLKKTDIMQQYNYNRAICIGDSYTDIKMSIASDVVFARDALSEHLKAINKPFYQWDSFFNVLEIMKNNEIFKT